MSAEAGVSPVPAACIMCVSGRTGSDVCRLMARSTHLDGLQLGLGAGPIDVVRRSIDHELHSRRHEERDGQGSLQQTSSQPGGQPSAPKETKNERALSSR